MAADTAHLRNDISTEDVFNFRDLLRKLFLFDPKTLVSVWDFRRVHCALCMSRDYSGTDSVSGIIPLTH
ncbi:MAG: hypothetical protein K0Q55_121 [Verrucomicrobia bacterium]|jgi:hypothetical protein|nr:hypothetical protein [Verrucomicrobiota bacterium]